jgi:exosortase/archaeosortase family protein
VIRLGEHRIGVVDACSGLSMLMTFLALSTGAAMVVKRPWLDRAVLVLASVPVALVSNLARIVLTGVLYERAGSKTAEVFYHDLAGWLMIPFALGLLWLLLKAWMWLVPDVAEERKEVVLVGVPGGSTEPEPVAGSRGRPPEGRRRGTRNGRDAAPVVIPPAPLARGPER